MSRSELTGLLLALCLPVSTHAAPIEHFGLAETDKYLLCLRALLVKPVFRDPSSFLGATGLRCPASRDELVNDLKARGETLVETEDWAFLHPSRFRESTGSPTPPLINWKRLVLVAEPRNWGGIPETRVLTLQELQNVGRVALRDARPTPVFTQLKADAEGTATVEYLLRATAVRLGAVRPEAVVGILGEPGWTSRLVYGELRDGEYRILWDSPLFYARMLEMGFQDVDGDGVKEVLITSRYGLNAEAIMLTIFDAQGHELTRQPRCEFDVLWGYDETGVVCPVVAQDITVDDPRGGKRDLLVRQMNELEHPKLHRYALHEGRYVDLGEINEEGS
jgi:hypothetical protein